MEEVFQTKKRASKIEFSLLARLGLMLYPSKKYTWVISLFCLVVWKLQSLALTLYFSMEYLEVNYKINVAVAISNFFLVDRLIGFDQNSSLLSLIFFAVIILTLLLLFLLGYFVYCATMHIQLNPLIIKFGCLYFHVINWTVLFPLFNIFISVIENFSNGNLVHSIDGLVLMSFFGICFVLFGAIFFLCKGFLQIESKGKDPLISKKSEYITREQIGRMFMYFIVVFVSESGPKKWILILADFAFNCYKFYQFFQILPYYKLIWLKIEASFQAINLCLSIINLYTLLVNSGDSNPGRFVLETWLLLVPISLKIALKILDNLLQRILFGNKELNNYQALHEFILLKHHLRNRVKADERARHLIYSELVILSRKLTRNNPNSEAQFKQEPLSKQEFINFVRAILMNKMKNSPKFTLFTLNYLRYSLLKTRAYLDVANRIRKLKNEKIKLSDEVLLLHFFQRIQDQLLLKAESQDQSLINIARYIKLESGANKIKQLAIDQARLQIKFWSHYSLNDTNLNFLRQLSTSIEEKKKEIKKFWGLYESYCKEVYLQPYLTYGLYLDLANYRVAEGQQFYKAKISHFFNKAHAKAKIEINNETIYQEGTATIMISANRDNLGEIIECSDSFTEISGYPINVIKGKNINIIMPPFYRLRHQNILSHFIDTGITKVLDSTRKVFIITQDDHIIPVLLSAKQNPYIENGFSFIGVMRLIHELRDYIIVKDSGKIDFMGKTIRNRLAIKTNPQELTIFDICPQFRPILNAFNKVSSQSAKDQKPPGQALLDQISRHKTMEKEGMESMKELLDPGLSSRRELSHLNSKAESRRFFSDMEQESKNKNAAMKNNFFALIGELRDSINLYKQFNDLGEDLRFKYGENEMDLFVKIEPEIVGKEWILILKIDGLFQRNNEEDESLSSFKDVNKKFTFGTTRSNQKLNSFRQYKSGSTRRESRGPSYISMGTPQGSLVSPRNFSASPMNQDYLMNNISMAPSPRQSLNRSNISGQFNTEYEKHDSLNVHDYVFMPQRSESRASSRSFHFEENNDPTQPGFIPSQNMTEKRSQKPPNSDVIEASETHDKLTINAIRRLFNKRDDVSSAGSSSLTTRNYIERTFESCLDALYIPQYLKGQFLLYFIVVVVVQIMIITQTVIKSNYMESIKSQGEIVITAYDRADNVDQLTWAIRLMNAVINGKYEENGKDMYGEFMLHLIERMNKTSVYNELLEEQISHIDNSLIDEFYFKGVRLYEVELSGLTGKYKNFDTFEIARIFINLCYKNNNKPKPLIPSRNLDYELIIYNSFDTLVLEAERVISLTRNSILLEIDNFTQGMNILLILGLLSIGLYFIATLLVVRTLNMNTAHFSSVLLRLSDEETLDIKTGLEHFIMKLTYSLENRGITDGPAQSSRLRSAKTLIDKKMTNSTKKKFTTKVFDLSSIYIVNLVTAVNFWPILLVMMVFMLIIHTRSSSEITKITQYQQELVTAADYMYRTNLGFIGLFDLIIQNGTTKLRGQPIVAEVSKILKFGGNNEAYLAPFRDSEGNYEFGQYSLLFNTSCFDRTIIPNSSSKLCFELSGQTGQIGSLVMNSIYEKTLTELKDSWLDSPRTEDLISDYLQRYYEYVYPINNLQDFFTNALTKKTKVLFQEYISNERARAVVIMQLEIILTLILLCVAIKVLFWKNLKREDEFKRFLKLIPMQILMSNRYLKTHLIITSGQQGELLKKLTQ